MDIQALFAEIGKGGWILAQMAVTSACIEDNEIVFVLVNTSEFRLPIDGKNRCIPHGHPEPEQIIIERPRLIREQRKKVDGGGWREVERVGTCMSFTNAGAKARNEQWRKDEEKRKHEEASQQHAESVSAFLVKQLELAGNGHVVSMTQDGAALVIEFENGHKLFVNSFGRGDGHCASILVEGSDTYTGEWDLEGEGTELIHHS